MNLYELITGKKYPVEDVYIGDIMGIGLNAGGIFLSDIFDIERRAMFLKTEDGFVLISRGRNMTYSLKPMTQMGGVFKEIVEGEPFAGHCFIAGHEPYLKSYMNAQVPEMASVRQLKKAAKKVPVVHFA